MSNFSSAPPSEAIVLGATVMAVAELFAHPVALLLSAFNFALLYNSALLHPNLRCILLAQSISIGVAEFCRIVYVAQKLSRHDVFWNRTDVSTILSLFCITFRSMVAHMLMAERALATLLFQGYADKKTPCFSAAMILLMSTIAAVITFLRGGGLWDVGLFTMLAICAIFCVGFVEIFILLLLQMYNTKKYRNGTTLSLGQKFQLSENVLTSRQLGPTFTLHFANLLLNNMSTFGIYFGAFSAYYQISTCIALSMLLMAIVDAMIELTVITHHPVLKRNALELAGKCSKWLNRRRVADLGMREQREVELRDIDGRKMAVSLGGEEHYRMMREWWN